MDTDLIVSALLVVGLVLLGIIVAYSIEPPETYSFMVIGSVVLGEKPDYIDIVYYNDTYFISLDGHMKPLVPGTIYEIDHGLGYVKILGVESVDRYYNGARGVMVNIEIGNTDIMRVILVATTVAGFTIIGVVLAKIFYDASKWVEQLGKTFNV